jgi:hypothetical protein
MLGLANFMTRRAWGEIETIVGKHEYDVTSQVTLENLEKEIALSPRGPSDRNYHDLVGSFDMGWNGRSSGNTCNSLSEHECAGNHDGSSKSMESQAAVELTMELSKEGHPLRGIVGGDDSSFKANIRHGHQAKVDAGILEKGSWPKDKSGRRVADKGKLPLNAPEVKEILADPTHCNKVFVKPLFAVACGRKSENPHGLTEVDCERLKVNMGYFIKMHRREPFPEFLRRSQPTSTFFSR